MATASLQMTEVLRAAISRRILLWLFLSLVSCLIISPLLQSSAELLPLLLLPRQVKERTGASSSGIGIGNTLFLYALCYALLMLTSLLRSLAHPGLCGGTMVGRASSLTNRLVTVAVGGAIGGVCGVLLHFCLRSPILPALLPAFDPGHTFVVAAAASGAAAAVHFLRIESRLLTTSESVAGQAHTLLSFMQRFGCAFCCPWSTLATAATVASTTAAAFTALRLLRTAFVEQRSASLPAAAAAAAVDLSRQGLSVADAMQQLAGDVWQCFFIVLFVLWALQLMQRSLALLISHPIDFLKLQVLQRSGDAVQPALFREEFLLEALKCNFAGLGHPHDDAESPPCVDVLRRCQLNSSRLLRVAAADALQQRWPSLVARVGRAIDDVPQSVPLLAAAAAAVDGAAHTPQHPAGGLRHEGIFGSHFLCALARTAALQDLNRVARSCKERRRILLTPDSLPLVLNALCGFIEAVALQVMIAVDCFYLTSLT